MASRIPDVLTCGTTTLSTNAAVISSGPSDCAEMIVQSDPDNTVDIFVGNATVQPIQLQPGQSFPITINFPGLLYGKAASGSPVVNWIIRSDGR